MFFFFKVLIDDCSATDFFLLGVKTSCCTFYMKFQYYIINSYTIWLLAAAWDRFQLRPMVSESILSYT